MGANTALIIGSDKDYCYVVKEFLESKGLITNLILDYNQGVDKLFNENPDITVLEIISAQKISSHVLGKIKNSDEIDLIYKFDEPDIEFIEQRKSVFLLEDTNQLNTLLAFLNSYFIVDQTLNKVTSTDKLAISDLSIYPLPIIISHIYANKLSGLLSINSNIKLKIYCEDGIPIYVEGGSLETALGRMLIKSGRIKDVKDYEKALDIASEKRQKLGEVLVSMELISSHELNDLLQRQVSEKLVRGFGLTNGTFSFDDNNSHLDNIIGYKTDYPHVIFEGLLNHFDINLIEELFIIGQKARKISLDKSINDNLDSLGLAPKYLKIAQQIITNTNTNSLIDDNKLDRNDTLTVLFFLYIMNLLKVATDPYSNIKKVFSSFNSSNNLNKSKDDESEEIDEIIDLEEEVPELVNNIENIDVKKDTEFIHETKDTLDNISKKELELEIESVAAVNESKVLPFKDQAKSNLSSDFESLSDTNSDLEGYNNIAEKELIQNFNLFHDDLEEKDYYELLGANRDSSPQEIKDLFYKLVKKYHPDIIAKIDSELREKADRVFSLITTAYQTLSDEEKKVIYDASDELKSLKSEAQILYKAENEYNEGLALLKQKKYIEAEKKFKNAQKINPEKAFYNTIISWTKFLNDKENEENIKECIGIIEDSIYKEPKNPDNYYYLGSIHKYMEDLRKAEINFSKAVEHDPDYIEAKRELRIIKNRKTERKNAKNLKTEKRFWSSLFKK